jgi:3-oxoacyl-[acyl-carrier protein] reductase
MDFGIEGRVAMVSAASKGIGLACAQALAAEGCTLSICARHDEELDRALQSLPSGSISTRCDVSKPEEIEAWFARTDEKLGKADILVTNTGGPPAGLVRDMTDDQWIAGIDSTLLNVVRMSRLGAERMRSRGWGRIVHITSLVAKEPQRLLPISSTLRTGLMALTKLQAQDLALEGVTVNAVLPGHTLTDRQRHLAEVRAKQDSLPFEEAMKRQAEGTAMKRFATPEEIAAAVCFLCSDKASYVSGVSLLVDGATTGAFG